MKSLEYLCVKSAIDNVNLEQALELLKTLEEKISKMKTQNIKTVLIKKCSEHKDLRKYVDLIQRIDKISCLNGEIYIDLYGNPKYGIIVEEEKNIEIYCIKPSDLFVEKETQNSLKEFGEIFTYEFEIDDVYPNWGSKVIDYLSTNAKIFEL